MTSSSLIYIVDDDADYRLLLKLFLKQSCPQHSVCLFSNGQALLEALPQMSPLPNLILLDRHMLGLDGHQTLELLKHSVYKRIPVVMMSSHASGQEIEGYYEAGANSFLIKELDPILLQVSLSTLCQHWLQLNQLPTLA